MKVKKRHFGSLSKPVLGQGLSGLRKKGERKKEDSLHLHYFFKINGPGTVLGSADTKVSEIDTVPAFKVPPA